MKQPDLGASRLVVDGVGEAIQYTRGALEDQTLRSAEVRSLFQSVETYAQGAESYETVRQSLAQLRADIAVKQQLAEDISRRVARLSDRQATDAQYSPEGVEGLRFKLRAASDRSSEEFLKVWLAAYAHAVVDWRLDACVLLVEIPFPAALSPYTVLFRTATEALKTSNFTHATGVLSKLASGHFDRTAPAGSVGVMLYVLLSRIHLRGEDLVTARADAERACELAPNDGRAVAALGHVERTAAEASDSKAERLFMHAIDLSPTLPDGYRGMALLSEARRQWEEAQRWHAQSLDTFASAVDAMSSLSSLLAPVSGLMYHVLAGRLLRAGRLDEASSAVERAIDLTVPSEAQSATLDPDFLKAQILETSSGTARKNREIAEAYLESGKQRYWASDYKTAEERLQRSIELRPDEVEPYWYLADVLRLRAILPQFPHVDPALSKKAMDVWAAGEKIELPSTAGNSWAYVVRGRLAGDQAFVDAKNTDYVWERLAYLECACVYLANGTRLVELARAYRSLANNTALKTLQRAIELDGDTLDKGTMSAHASILINLGQYEAAAVILERLREAGDDASDEDSQNYPSWRALVSLQLRQFARGLDEIKVYPEDSPDPWLRRLRGDLRRLTGNKEEARRDYAWLWENRDESYMDAEYAAWAAYHLGRFEDSLARAKPMTAQSGQIVEGWLLSGLTQVALGRPKEALQSFVQSVAAALTVNDIRYLEIELESIDQQWHANLGSAYRDLTSALEAKRAALAPGRQSAIAELQTLLKSPSMEPGTWEWIAAQASFARLAAEAGQTAAAATAYTALATFPRRFPAAAAALATLQAGTRDLQAGA